MAKVSKVQKLVNDIYARYGIDLTNHNDEDLEALAEALTSALKLDISSCESPSMNEDEDDAFGGLSHDDDDSEVNFDDEDEA